MEKSGGKRNHKNQKNKNKKEEKDSVNGKDEIIKKPTPSTIDNEPEPQPQRANRRNRSEVTKNPPPEASTPKVLEKPSESKVEVDHSHLKRETEEITKLTKKFSKREISSNWHRYSAPDSVDNDTTVEYEAPADFSDLIQVSASRGGHLQLKEEQDWTAVSGAELGGYFALDLKALNEGLACIPVHERLRIPSQVLTEDDVNKFNDAAKKASVYYNTEFSDPKNQTVNILTSLTKSQDKIEEITNSETSCTNMEERLILDVETSANKLLELTLDPVISFEGQLKEIKVAKQLDSNINVGTHNVNQDSFVLEEPKPKRGQFNYSEINKGVSLNSNNLAKDLTTEFSVTDKENVQNQKTTTPNNSKFTEPNSNSKPNKNDISLMSVSKEEFRKDPISNLNKMDRISGSIKSLEEDDDLDFLLSLKAPIKIEKAVKTSSAPTEEMSILPSGNKVAATATVPQTSDLDDWLDSVLQD